MGLPADELDGYERSHVYADGTVLRISVQRTEDSSYPSGWRYTFHFGALTPGPGTLEDGTIRRYDNAHEDTKGHELHAAPDPEPTIIEFPGIEELYERFWDEIPKSRGEPEPRTEDDHD